MTLTQSERNLALTRVMAMARRNPSSAEERLMGMRYCQLFLRALRRDGQQELHDALLESLYQLRRGRI